MAKQSKSPKQGNEKTGKSDKKFVEKCDRYNYSPCNIISSVLRRDYEAKRGAQ